MAYFDTKKETILTVEASHIGISAILSQKVKGQKGRQVVAYANRALTGALITVEKRYSQTESLGIVWGIENFHLYVYGTHFRLLMDHKPLKTIYENSRSKPSVRIERMVLRLQPYVSKYRAGDKNHAEYMSRHPRNESISTHSKISVEYVNFVTKHTVYVTAMTLKEIIEATNIKPPTSRYQT